MTSTIQNRKVTLHGTNTTQQELQEKSKTHIERDGG